MSTKTAVIRYSIFHHIRLNTRYLKFTSVCTNKQNIRRTSDIVEIDFFFIYSILSRPIAAYLFPSVIPGAGFLLHHCLGGRLIGLVSDMV